MKDGNLTERFLGIIGCLQQFIEQRENRRVKLKKCLEIVFSDYKKANFRGVIDFDRIVSIRDKIPHGRAYEIDIEDAKYIGYNINLICSVSRFVIFKKLGMDNEKISEAFLRVPHRYGMFAPQP